MRLSRSLGKKSEKGIRNFYSCESLLPSGRDNLLWIKYLLSNQVLFWQHGEFVEVKNTGTCPVEERKVERCSANFRLNATFTLLLTHCSAGGEKNREQPQLS